jgi:hypothetical protein
VRVQALRWITGLVGSGGGLGALAWFGKAGPVLILGVALFLLTAMLIVVGVLLVVWIVDDGTPGSRVEKITKLIRSFRGTDGDGPPQGAPG